MLEREKSSLAASNRFIDRRNGAHLLASRGPFINGGKKQTPRWRWRREGNNGKAGLKFARGYVMRRFCIGPSEARFI